MAQDDNDSRSPVPPDETSLELINRLDQELSLLPEQVADLWLAARAYLDSPNPETERVFTDALKSSEWEAAQALRLQLSTEADEETGFTDEPARRVRNRLALAILGTFAVLLILILVIAVAILNRTNQPIIMPTLPPMPTSTSLPSPTPTSTPIGTVSSVNANEDWINQHPDGWIQAFDGVQMVLVPPGCFLMGHDENHILRTCIGYDQLVKPFWIDRFEANDDGNPIILVSWDDASDICAERNARLPTEIEWEYAARGPSSGRWPWGGDEPIDTDTDEEYLIYQGHSDNEAAAVGVQYRKLGRSWVGAYDMAGNVAEWTSSIYTKNYPYSPFDSNNVGAIGPRVVRGGSWGDDEEAVQATWRVQRSQRATGTSFIGFRCVRSQNPDE